MEVLERGKRQGVGAGGGGAAVAGGGGAVGATGGVDGGDGSTGFQPPAVAAAAAAARWRQFQLSKCRTPGSGWVEKRCCLKGCPRVGPAKKRASSGAKNGKSQHMGLRDFGMVVGGSVVTQQLRAEESALRRRLNRV